VISVGRQFQPRDVLNFIKPSLTPTLIRARLLKLPHPPQTPTPTSTATPTPTPTPTLTPTPTPTNTATEVPQVTVTYISEEEDPTEEYPTEEIPEPIGTKWIDVDLSDQMLYAYVGDTPIASFLVSTGLPDTPTITGTFYIYVMYLFDDMEGPGYYLPDVPYTMYFYDGYGIHGTYWHHNFGTPMSHGCINMETSDAEWLYYWSYVGLMVNIHN